MTTLTQCQQQVLDMLISYQKERGFPPTNLEVATMLGYRSVNAAVEHLRALEKKGVITIKRGVARGSRFIPWRRTTTARRSGLSAHCLPVRKTPGCVQPIGYMREA